MSTLTIAAIVVAVIAVATICLAIWRSGWLLYLLGAVGLTLLGLATVMYLGLPTWWAAIGVPLALLALFWVFFTQSDNFVLKVIATVVGGALLLGSFIFLIVGVKNVADIYTDLGNQVTTVNETVEQQKQERIQQVNFQNSVDRGQTNNIANLEERVKALEEWRTIVDQRLDALEAWKTAIENGTVSITLSNGTTIRQSDLTDAQRRGLAESLASLGFVPGQYQIGQGRLEAEVSQGAFTDSAMSYDQIHKAIVNPTTAGEVAARDVFKARIDAAVANGKITQEDADKFMRGENIVLVNFPGTTCYSGSASWENGVVGQSGTLCSTNDTWAIPVTESGVVLWEAAIRFKCVNPGVETPPSPVGGIPSQPQPVRETPPSGGETTPPPPAEETTPPPTETPVCPPGTHGEYPVCKDDPVNNPTPPPGGGGVAPEPDPEPSAPAVPSPEPTAEYTPPAPLEPVETPRENPVTDPEPGTPETTQVAPAVDPCAVDASLC